MTHLFRMTIDAWSPEGEIPSRFAFGKPGADGPFATSDNVSPKITWSDAPAGTRSFALICHDPDVPSIAENVNQEGLTVSAGIPRIDFYHWVLIDIPAVVSILEEGVGSRGITPRGKVTRATEVGVHGQNTYTNWFAGDPDMEGVYGAYDGPCPPWNDEIPHRYYFTLYALNVETLGLSGDFTGDQVLEAMRGHVLAECAYMGKYSMNPLVSA